VNSIAYLKSPRPSEITPQFDYIGKWVTGWTSGEPPMKTYTKTKSIEGYAI